MQILNLFHFLEYLVSLHINMLLSRKWCLHIRLIHLHGIPHLLQYIYAMSYSKGNGNLQIHIISYPCSFGSRASSELEVYSGHKYTKSDPVLGQTKQHGYWWRFGVLSHSFQTNWKWMGRKLLYEDCKPSFNKHSSHKGIWPQATDKVRLWNMGTEFTSWRKKDKIFQIY